MSNHFHVQLTDVEGRLPEFVGFVNSLLARSLNAMVGTSGTVFEKHYNIVAATDPDEVLEQAAYALANPCEADLVRHSRDWGGFSSRRMRYGKKSTFERPKLGLWKSAGRELDVTKSNKRKKWTGRSPGRAARSGGRSKLPETASLTLVRPDVYPELSDAALRAEVFRRLKRRKKGVLGMDRVLAQKWWHSPRGTEDLMQTKPTVAGGTKWARREALGRRKEFEEQHRRARAAFRAGQLDVEWPYGTWLMCVRHGLRCATAPP
jgi:hypothetical protein